MDLYAHEHSGINWSHIFVHHAFQGQSDTGIRKAGHWSQRYWGTSIAGSPLEIKHGFYDAGITGDKIYLYRDGRDVAVSMWRNVRFRAPGEKDKTFSEFLETPLNWYHDDGSLDVAHSGMTVVAHWKAHLDSWYGAPDTLFLRYEDLLTNPSDTLDTIEAFLGIQILGEPTIATGSIRWPDFFTAGDLTVFFNIVPIDYWGLFEP